MTGWIVPGACALALLYYGRPVLEPLAVAGILTLTLAPLARRLRALGLGHAAASFVSVGFVAAGIVALFTILFAQVTDVARELPQYRAAFGAKVEQLGASVVRPLERWESEMAAILAEPRDGRAGFADANGMQGAATPIPVEIRRPRGEMGATVSKWFAFLWGPLGEAAIVVVLLLFMMLGRDSIRERLVRLTGENEVARTMQALGETDEGVSRFFASLLVTNFAFGIVASIILALLGVPHATLWGALAGTLRFVPYVGVPAAIAAIAMFAAAVAPGWSLALASAAALVALDVVVAHGVEPQVYGHRMGIAPFGIIAAALFWGTVWGPVGLIVSAPLTLCLVVAGRHVPALAPIAILFGDAPGTTVALRLYQRALAGDIEDVVDDARAYVRRHGLARYFDDMLLPAFALGSADMAAGRIGRKQHAALRAAVVKIVDALGGARKGRRIRDAQGSMGAQLRGMREAAVVPSGAEVICASLANERDEVLSELLVRALRGARIEARSVALDATSVSAALDDGLRARAVLLIDPADGGLEEWRRGCRALRARVPGAPFAAVIPYETHAAPGLPAEVRREVDTVLRSFSEAVSYSAASPLGAEPRAAA